MTEHPRPYPIDDIEDALEVLEPDWADKLAASRKGIAAGVGLVAQLVQSNVLHGTAQSVATGIVGFATLLGVYQVRNVDLPDDNMVAVEDEPAPSPRAPGIGPDGKPVVDVPND